MLVALLLHLHACRGSHDAAGQAIRTGAAELQVSSLPKLQPEELL